jgi:hypothetical protein
MQENDFYFFLLGGWGDGCFRIAFCFELVSVLLGGRAMVPMRSWSIHIGDRVQSRMILSRVVPSYFIP